MQVLIRQAKIADPGSDFHDKVVDILVEDGVIKDIAPSLKTKADKVIEAEELYASPGWTDIFADYREPGFEHKETIASGLATAAAGGFTHVFTAPNTSPAADTKSVIEFLLQKSRGHAVSLHPLGAVSQQVEGKNLAEMLDMHSHGAVAFTDGWKPLQHSNLMLKALEYVKAFDGTIIQIPVETSLSSGGLMHEGPVSTKLGMPGIPTLSETLIIHRDIELARYTDSKLHISGVSSAEGVDMIRKAKAQGVKLTCSVTPYHLALTDEALDTYSSFYKVSPPLRSEADRQALIKGLKDGTIDCIASHHRPQEWDAKEKEFEYAADGMNIQEIAFAIVWNAAGKKAGLERIIDAFTTAPARIFGLETSGIKKGNKASLTLFSTSAVTHLQEGDVKSASRNNPFIGQELMGKVLGIINNGQLILNK